MTIYKAFFPPFSLFKVLMPMKAPRTAHYSPGPVSCYQEPFQARVEEWEMQSHTFSFRCQKVLGFQNHLKWKSSWSFLSSRHIFKCTPCLWKASQKSNGNFVLGYRLSKVLGHLLKETRWLNFSFPGFSIDSVYFVVLKSEAGRVPVPKRYPLHRAELFGEQAERTMSALLRAAERAELPTGWVGKKRPRKTGAPQEKREEAGLQAL